MIPKIIHYVWVGNGEKDIEIKKCIKSWNEKLKDWKIIEWNEENFNIHSNSFVEKAYELRKYAFVSDYIRAYAIYNYGGIYLDTDIMVLESLEELLNNNAVIGFESKEYISAAIFGAEKGHALIKDLLDYYDKVQNFKYEHKDNNSIIITNILKKKNNLNANNTEQILNTGIHVYPSKILSVPSKDSKTIHLVTATWNKKALKLKDKVAKKILSNCNRKWKLCIYIKILNLYHKFKKGDYT